MKIKKLNVVYFSATGTTKKVVRAIAQGIDADVVEEFDLTHARTVAPVPMDANDLLLIGVPSYSGRVPQLIVKYLNDFRGQHTPAIVACTYGNRDYDDTLIELRDIVSSNGFRPVSAGAFVAQHSIFPKLGEGRPTTDDLLQAEHFGKESVSHLAELEVCELVTLDVKGNRPYRAVSNIPLRPSGNRRCNKCGICAHMCPVGAIDASRPKRTDKERCISCAHCIDVCPRDARSFGGLMYKLASHKFYKKFATRKNNELIYS